MKLLAAAAKPEGQLRDLNISVLVTTFTPAAFSWLLLTPSGNPAGPHPRFNYYAARHVCLLAPGSRKERNIERIVMMMHAKVVQRMVVAGYQSQDLLGSGPFLVP